MPLELYHLSLSQSERIVWLLEELSLPYTLHTFSRDPTTAMAPAALKSAHPAGTAPFLRDTNVFPPVCLSESTAIAAYLLAVYSPQSPTNDTTPLDRKLGDPEYAAFLQWFHYANGSLQAAMYRHMQLLQSSPAPENPEGEEGGSEMARKAAKRWSARLDGQLRMIDEHLAQNKWFAGEGFSAADCMSAFSLTTMRGFAPLDIGGYPNILRWLQDVAARPAYRKALDKGDNGMEPMIEPKTRMFTQFPSIRQLERIVQASR